MNFDSGFFAAEPGRVYHFNHSLGTTKLLIFTYYADSVNGQGMQQLVTDISGASVSQWVGAFASEITRDAISVQTGGRGLTLYAGGIKARGYLRIVAVALP